jgi:Protein of unknown function (DUF3500)
VTDQGNIRPRRVISAADQETFVARVIAAADEAVGEPLRGITSGPIPPGLFPIWQTGISCEPILEAAEAFLSALGGQREDATFPLNSVMWRRWNNTHSPVLRHGVCLADLTEDQRQKGIALVAATLSSAGLTTARDVMRLNETAAELTGHPEEYGEWLYWLSVFGEPSGKEPWGWQIDGHHLIVNCFVLGDQLVTTPMFMGSEPVRAESGKYAGTRVFEQEEQAALAFLRSLDESQHSAAVVGSDLPRDVFTSAQRDNRELAHEGIQVDQLNAAQKGDLLGLISTYLGRTRPDHGRVLLEDVQSHMDETWFSWRGGWDEDSPFYYRIHSPVLLIEFDHQAGVIYDNSTPNRRHIHTVVRTPNGNDYGADLLRQHHQLFDHTHGDHQAEHPQ